MHAGLVRSAADRHSRGTSMRMEKFPPNRDAQSTPGRSRVATSDKVEQRVAGDFTSQALRDGCNPRGPPPALRSGHQSRGIELPSRGMAPVARYEGGMLTAQWCPRRRGVDVGYSDWRVDGAKLAG